jgi:hypothetical protein
MSSGIVANVHKQATVVVTVENNYTTIQPPRSSGCRLLLGGAGGAASHILSARWRAGGGLFRPPRIRSSWQLGSSWGVLPPPKEAKWEARRSILIPQEDPTRTLGSWQGSWAAGGGSI